MRTARGSRTLRGVELEADRVAEIAGRPLASLNRRDVAIALLRVGPDDALASLPGIRRGLLAAGNPLSAAFWDSAEAILHKINDHEATFGDVHGWLEATGTEPTGIIGLHVWAEQPERSALQEEMHARLVSYLEERLAAGDIDPDRLVSGDESARQAYLALQERWMTSPLPDGRVPMTVLLDEQDEQFIADWEAADREALNALRAVLDEAGERPLPREDLRAACARLREDIARPGWPGQLLIAFAGESARTLPADDVELWLKLAAAVASPQGDPAAMDDKDADSVDWSAVSDLELDELDDELSGDLDDDLELDEDDELDETSRAIAAVCALDYFDWLAVMSALASGGPGTPASAADLARYVRDFDPDGEEGDDTGDEDNGQEARDEVQDPDFTEFDDDDYDELSIEGLFLHVTALWSVLGAIDEDDRLTQLGWWGLPEAMQRVWSGRS